MKKIAFVNNYELFKRLQSYIELNSPDSKVVYFDKIKTITDIESIDLIIHNIDDYSYIEKLKSEDRDKYGLTHIPIIYIIDIFRGGSFALKNTLDDYLFKPFEPELLLNRIYVRLEFKTLYDKVRKMISQQVDILDLSEILSSSTEYSYKKRLSIVVEKLSEMFKVENLSIILLDENEEKAFVVADKITNSDNFKEIEIEIKKYPEIEEAIITKKPFYVEDVSDYEKLDKYLHLIKGKNIFSILILPIIYNDKVLGVISIKFPDSNSNLYKELINYSLIIANTTAIALKNAKMVDELKGQTEIATSYKVKQQEFINSIKHYSFFVNKASIPMFIIDKHGTIHLVNTHAEKFLNYNRFDILKVNFFDILNEESQKNEFLQTLKSLDDKNYYTSIDIDIKTPSEIKKNVMFDINMFQKNIFILNINNRNYFY